MRPLPRFLLNALTVPSLLLFIATVGLWVRSHRVRDEWKVEVEHGGWSVTSDHGQVAVERTWPIPLLPDSSVLSDDSIPSATATQWEFPITRRQPWSRAGLTLRETAGHDSGRPVESP